MSKQTTLCYIENEGCYLMLHRVKKKNDVNQDKWIGIGGKFEQDESPYECVVREMKEETGMDFEVYDAGNAAYRRPFFMGAGFTDESCNAVFGYASGRISRDDMEDTESIQVLLVDRKEAARILKEERVSIRAAYLLMNFLHADDKEPFAFLE